MPKTAVSSYYLPTKLHRPPPPEDYILRTRLLTEMEKISHYQVAFITAPAGYGKSTLVSAWAEQVDCPNAWLSVDEGDDDLVVFMGYFITAIQSVFPRFGEQVQALGYNTSRPSVATVTQYLLQELDQLTHDFVLVIDDFQALTDPDIHKLLGGLLLHPLPHLHLVLTSRHDLPPVIAKLRAQGRLLELRVKDLRFSAAEVAEFIAITLPTQAGTAMIENLSEKTEGWPVGLRLATMAIRRWGTGEYEPAILHVENQYIIEYLVNEVLAGQSAATRDFLFKSAILNQFCAPLCAAVMGTDTFSAKILPHLEQEGLFLESLDTHKSWFRYHQLFRDLLRSRLEEQYPAAEVAALHLRASQWLAANGFVEDSITHALAAGDVTTAASNLLTGSYTLLNEERWLLLESLLHKFSPDDINEEPTLLVLLAWLHQARMHLGRVESIREKLESHLITAVLPPKERRFLECSFHTFAAIHHNWNANYEETIFHAHQALALTQPDWGLTNAYIWIHLSSACHNLLGIPAGLVALDEYEHLAKPLLSHLRKQIAVGFIDWLTGDLAKLVHTARNGLEIINERSLFMSRSMLYYQAGSAYYEQNELKTAEQYFRSVLELKHGYQLHAFILCTIGQALIYQAQNKVVEAWQMSETAVDFCLEMEHSPLLFSARAFQAELALRQGQLERASGWASSVDPTSLSKLMPYFYQPQMTLPKIWFAEGTPASLKKTEVELARLHQIVTTAHNIPGQIAILGQQALLFQAQGNMEAAEDVLRQAVRLAQPGGFIRSFVDLGSKMAALLKHLYMQGYATKYLQQLLDAFPTSRTITNNAAYLTLVDPLTDRETEILGMLAQRLNNNEIAQILVISPETVKRHTSNIYQKLQVNNRRQAVAKAFALNLLVEIS